MICVLMRHGETDAMFRGITGWLPGVHLNGNGREQAQRLPDRLAEYRIRAIYSSPLERTRETARPLAERLGLEVEPRKDFIEIDCGEWAGLSFEELDRDPRWKRFNTYRSSTRIPGGELMTETQTRMVSALEELRESHRDEAIAVFSHGDPIRVTICHYLGIPLDFIHRIEISPAAINVLALHEWGAQVLRLNA